MERMLTSTATLTPIQAVSCMGRAVHAGVARQIVRGLLAEGSITSGLRYGSDCSGIDLFAAGVEAELREEWQFVFASERMPHVRKGLLAAWKDHGLTDAACYTDARRTVGDMPPAVDLYVLTADCTEHSARNHHRTADGWASSLGDIWAMLGYVRMRKPRVVVVENVNQPSVVQPLTGLLGRLEGYDMRGAVLTPEGTAKARILRERHFWVLTARDGLGP